MKISIFSLLGEHHYEGLTLLGVFPNKDSMLNYLYDRGFKGYDAIGYVESEMGQPIVDCYESLIYIE